MRRSLLLLLLRLLLLSARASPLPRSSGKPLNLTFKDPCTITKKVGPWRKRRPLTTIARRIFVFAMQSSGASTFLYLLAQLPHSCAVLDLWVGRDSPRQDHLGLSDKVQAVLLKATVNTVVDLTDYLNTFRPDFSILLLRHPAHNLKSISTKPYRGVAGDVPSKFAALEEAFLRRRDLFTMTIFFEDIFLQPDRTLKRLQAKLSLTRAAAECLFEFNRSPQHLEAFTNYHCTWCGEWFTKSWGFGNLHTAAPASSAAAISTVLDPKYLDKQPSDYEFWMANRLAPQLSKAYAVAYPHLSGRSILSSSAAPSSSAPLSQGRKKRRMKRDARAGDERVPPARSRTSATMIGESDRLNFRAERKAREAAINSAWDRHPEYKGNGGFVF